MKIDHTNLFMTSSRSFSVKKEEEESLTVWKDSDDRENKDDKISISPKAKCCLAETFDDLDDEEFHEKNLALTLKELLVEILSGREVRILDPAEFADRSPEPAPEELYEDVYAQMPERGWLFFDRKDRLEG